MKLPQGKIDLSSSQPGRSSGWSSEKSEKFSQREPPFFKSNRAKDMHFECKSEGQFMPETAMINNLEEQLTESAVVMKESPVARSLDTLMPAIQRQPAPMAEVKKEKLPKLNYKSAKARNISFSNPDSLGWGTKLETVAAGLYKGWFDLWKAGKYDEFADAVAQYQADNGAKKRAIDGVLGLGTWSKIAGYGEAIAGIQSVKWEASKKTCTIASEERIQRGHKLAKGTRFVLPKDKSAKTFNTILQSIEGNMADIDEVYRGTGAAGAMVYAGLATFVPEADIWTGGLRPGAAMQVWGYRDAYDLMRKGVVEYKVKGVTKTRRIKPDDANFYGTSFVFVRYDDPNNPTKMLVRHFNRPEWQSKNSFDVWVAANIN